MSAVDHNAQAGPDRVKTDLIRQLRVAQDAIEQIEEIIKEADVGTWSDGRSEGWTLACAHAATAALRNLRIHLQCRLDWPEDEPVSALATLAHAVAEPPVTDAEDEAFDGIPTEWIKPDVDHPCF